MHPEHFDSTFFGYSAKLANFMDPRHRILLETSYECIADAGYNPKELSGTKTGIYINKYLYKNPWRRIFYKLKRVAVSDTITTSDLTKIINKFDI